MTIKKESLASIMTKDTERQTLEKYISARRDNDVAQVMDTFAKDDNFIEVDDQIKCNQYVGKDAIEGYYTVNATPIVSPWVTYVDATEDGVHAVDLYLPFVLNARVFFEFDTASSLIKKITITNK